MFCALFVIKKEITFEGNLALMSEAMQTLCLINIVHSRTNMVAALHK